MNRPREGPVYAELTATASRRAVGDILRRSCGHAGPLGDESSDWSFVIGSYQ